CLIESGDERWKGVGRTRRSAFRHALARAFPSRAARELLTAAVADWNDESDVAHGLSSKSSSSPSVSPGAFRRVDAAFVLPHEAPGAPFVPSPPTRRVVKQIQVEDALDQFDELERSLRASLDTASVLCAPRQKLLLLSWVALARHIEE